MQSARIFPGQSLPEPYGRNNTGGTLIRPGGRDTYPAFWIRDYAMSLETGFVSEAEQKHMLRLVASAQCDQAWITKGGSMVPFGAIPDHIRVDNSLPIYFPGTYDYDKQGTREFGMTPPYDDQFYFIHAACHYVKCTGDAELLREKVNGVPLIERLEIAFKTPPVRQETGIVFTNAAFRGVDFGFRDAIEITGDLCFPSLLKYRAAKELGGLLWRLGDQSKPAMYHQIAASIKNTVPQLFLNDDGMLRASNGKSGQADVWATAFAVYLHVLEGENLAKACQHLAGAYKNGALSCNGNIRHILTSDDFSDNTAWESAIVAKNQYQNGAYWGTPLGWVAEAIWRVDPESATRLVKEYIADLRENDYRKGSEFSAPLECFDPPDCARGPVYLTTVACPYTVFKEAIHGLSETSR